MPGYAKGPLAGGNVLGGTHSVVARGPGRRRPKPLAIAGYYGGGAGMLPCTGLPWKPHNWLSNFAPPE